MKRYYFLRLFLTLFFFSFLLKSENPAPIPTQEQTPNDQNPVPEQEQNNQDMHEDNDQEFVPNCCCTDQFIAFLHALEKQAINIVEKKDCQQLSPLDKYKMFKGTVTDLLQMMQHYAAHTYKVSSSDDCDKLKAFENCIKKAHHYYDGPHDTILNEQTNLLTTMLKKIKKFALHDHVFGARLYKKETEIEE
jgi:hypothetical protein